MYYRVPKKIREGMMVSAVFFAAAISLLVLTAMKIGYQPVNTAATLIFVTLALATLSRFTVFGCVYQLSENYGDFSLTLYRIVRQEKLLAGKIEFSGKEALFPLDRAGRRRVRDCQKQGNMTVNLIPNKRYALTYEQDGKPCYLILELNKAFAEAIQKELARAKIFYSANADKHS